MVLSDLIAEVQALTGRTDDTVLITSARVIRWLNEAQLEIVDRCVGHIDLEYKHVTAITLVANTYAYSIASISPAIRHLLEVYYLDGANSIHLAYRNTGEFDKRYPSPPDLVSGIPTIYTRRTNTIEVYPVPSGAEAGYYLRLDYTKTPTPFAIASLSASCVMTDADKGLIYYAVAEAFRAIGGDKVAEANNYREPVNKTGHFYTWLDDYQQKYDGLYGSEATYLLSR